MYSWEGNSHEADESMDNNKGRKNTENGGVPYSKSNLNPSTFVGKLRIVKEDAHMTKGKETHERFKNLVSKLDEFIPKLKTANSSLDESKVMEANEGNESEPCIEMNIFVDNTFGELVNDEEKHKNIPLVQEVKTDKFEESNSDKPET